MQKYPYHFYTHFTFLQNITMRHELGFDKPPSEVEFLAKVFSELRDGEKSTLRKMSIIPLNHQTKKLVWLIEKSQYSFSSDQVLQGEVVITKKDWE